MGPERWVEQILSGGGYPAYYTLQGDSGGPLTVEEDGVHTLAGVTSYGLARRFQDKVDLKQTISQWD